MSEITELFGLPADASLNTDWKSVVRDQRCPYLSKTCIKVRKSSPDISIGTCTVRYGGSPEPIIICPHRLRERNQIFTDSLHLLTGHVPGNEIHVVPEIGIPGGNVDFFLTSVNEGGVADFVGIEIQTLDTTGTVWPARQRFLRDCGFKVGKDADSDRGYGMNWKMTAKTILVQLHHKIETFQHVNKHLVLSVQDKLLAYMRKEFSFDHLSPAKVDDSMHFHSYSLRKNKDQYRLALAERLSTDMAGIAKCLGLMDQARVELKQICKLIEGKISEKTLLRL